ncbi:MAG: protein kinase [Acidobacteriota bacterium]|nr:protein kinase [Acidobacteriota bacterium]
MAQEEQTHIDRKIGPYLLERKLGRGGMGSVYLGRRHDDELEMTVAVKLAHEKFAASGLAGRFRRERQLLADLKHPYIAMLLDAGTTEDGKPYFIMEHIEGRTIDAWCTAEQPALPDLLRLFRKIVSAVGFAHKRGVVHRDLKPGNLMVSEEGEPKLLDFGIAYLAGDEVLTGVGEALLTPEYAAPEQFQGRPVTAATDIYALGLVLLELLTGKRPGSWGCSHLDAVTQLITSGRSLDTDKTTGGPRTTAHSLLATGDLEPLSTVHSADDLALMEAETLIQAVNEQAKTIKAGPLASETETGITVVTDVLAQPPRRRWVNGLPPEVVPRSDPVDDAENGRQEPVPEALGHVLRTALAPRPEYRYDVAGELLDDIDRVLASLPETQRTLPTEKKFDAVFWYHPQDKAMVEELAFKLADRGLKVWLDAWALHPELENSREMGAALDAGHACLVFVGPGQTRPWLDDMATRDRLALRAGDLQIFPVLLPDADFPEKQSELPAALRGLMWTTLSHDLDDSEVEPLARALQNTRLQAHAEPTGICPFRGLEAFREEDRKFFFGREAVSQRIVKHLEENPFIGVLGPSGSGKSSVALAGVVPQLGELGFVPLLMTPTARPLEELAFKLQGLFQKEGENQTAEMLLNRLRGAKESLYFMSRELFSAGASRGLCLVIDQFEEIFTLVADDESRNRFVDLLCYALDQPESRVTVLLTMRSDFLGKNVAFPDLNSYIVENSIQVGPMSRNDLARAIECPARLAGLSLEPGLLDRILDEVTGASGELPLMEHALLELYERRNGGLLTLQAYEEIGGIEGALARRAEAEYGQLDDTGRETLRKMFTLCLIHPGEGVEDTRRRATREELTAVGTTPSLVDNLLERWVQARLLTSAGDNERGRVMIDVAHETLIRKWDRIRAWMTEDRETARLVGRLRRSAQAWEASARDRDLLLRGGPLMQMDDLVKRESANLGSLEKEFVAAGLRHARRRKHLAVFAGCLGFVLAGVAFAMFFTARSARQDAEKAQDQAEERTRQGNYNLAMMFDQKAGTALNAGRPHEAWLYATAALSRDIPAGKTLPGPAGRFADPDMNAAGRMIWASPVAIPANSTALSPDGDLLAMAGNDHTIRLASVTDGTPAGLLPGHHQTIHTMTFSPDGRLLASVSDDRTVRVWNLPDGGWAVGEARFVLEHRETLTAAVFSPDGRKLFTASEDGAIRSWDMATGALTLSREKDEPVRALAASQDGKTLAYGLPGGAVGLIALNTGSEQRFEGGAAVRELCFAGEYLAVTRDDGSIRVLDPEDNDTVFRAGRNSGVAAMTALPDRLFTLDGNGAVTVYSIEEGKVIGRWQAFPGEGGEDDDSEDEAEDDNGEDEAEDDEGEDDDEDDENEIDDEEDEAGEDDEVRESIRSIKGSLQVARNGDLSAGVLSGGFPTLWRPDSGEVIAAPAGHASEVLSAVFSPDGKYLATGSGDNTVKLWPLQESKPVITLTGHTDEVLDTAFSPDGRLLASCAADHTIRLRDMKNPAEAVTLTKHTDEVTSVCFSPDNRLLASVSADETLQLWDLTGETPQPRATLRGHKGPVQGVAFSPDGRLLATASGDETVKLWAVASGRVLRTFRGHKSNVVSVLFTPDGKTLASSSDDRTIKLWSVPDGALVGTLTGHRSDVAGLAFSKDGTILASASDDQTIHLWDMTTRTLKTTLAGHGAPVVGVDFSPDGKTLASASEDRTARLWDVSTRVETSLIEAHGSAVVSLAFSPDGAWLASSSEDQTVKLWRKGRWDEAVTLRGHTSDIGSVAFSPDGRQLASASDDRTVKLWDVRRPEQAELVRTLRGHEAEVVSVAYAPDGRMLVTASDDRTIKLWDLADGKERATLTGHESDVVSVIFSSDGSMLASASDDRTIRLWDVSRSVETTKFTGHASDVTAVAFSPDGNLLVSASTDLTLKLWDTVRGTELLTLTQQGAFADAVAWSPDGKLLVATGSDGIVRLWRVLRPADAEGLTCLPLAHLSGHGGEVNSAAFSPDGQLLATGSGDQTIRLSRPGDLNPITSNHHDRAAMNRLFQRSLHHFGYRLDGFQLVDEPRFALQIVGGKPASGLTQRRPENQKLGTWLANPR